MIHQKEGESVTEHKRLAENIQTRMAFYVSNDRDHFDENKEAGFFFCKPLSLLFDADVTNANSPCGCCSSTNNGGAAVTGSKTIRCCKMVEKWLYWKKKRGHPGTEADIWTRRC